MNMVAAHTFRFRFSKRFMAPRAMNRLLIPIFFLTC